MDMLYTANPRASYLALKGEIDAAIARVLDGNAYILGPAVDAVGAHGAPFIVVAFEPELGEGTEAVVGRDRARREVRVVVDDGLALGVAMVEAARELALEQEIVVEDARGRHGA